MKLLILLCPIFCYAQGMVTNTEIDSFRASIQIAQENKDFSSYYHKLDSFERHIVELKNFVLLDSLHSYYDYLPSSKKDSILYRKYLMYHGFRIKQYTGELSFALEFYLKAHNYLENKNRLDEQFWYTEKYIATIYSRLNDYDKALFFSRKVVDHLIEIGDKGKLGRHYRDIGDLFLWKRDTVQALSYYDKGLELGKSSNNVKAITGNAISLATYYLEIGQKRKFLMTYKYAANYIKGLSNINDQQQRLAQFETLLGDYYQGEGDLVNASKQYLKGIEILDEEYDSKKVREIAKVCLKLSQMYLNFNDLESSNAYCEQGLEWLIPDYNSGLPSLNQISSENTFVEFLILKSDYYQRKFNHEKLDSALMSIELALHANMLLDEEIIFSDSRYISLSLNKSIISKAIELLFELWRTTKSEKYIIKAKKLFLRSKSVVLNEKKQRADKLVGIDKTPKDKILAIEEGLLSCISHRSDKDINRDSIDDLILHYREELKVEYGKLELDQIDVIHEKYIEFFEGDNYYYSIDNFSSEKFRLLGVVEKINHDVAVVYENLSSRYKEYSLESPMNRLKQLLPKEVLETDEVVIIPDGALFSIPFEVLTVGENFLLNSTNVRYQYSTSWKEYEYTSPNSILCIAPDYNSKGTAKLLALKYRDEEVLLIKNSGLEKVNVLDALESSSTSESFSEYDILHFSGHAHSDENTSYLYSNELKKISSDYFESSSQGFGTVVLSACRTGMGKYIKGEGVRSLAYGFLSSGTENVIYSLWDVNDRSNTKIVEKFYKNIVNGDAPPVALSKAKKEFLELATPITKHPYYWAGLVCAGHPTSIDSGMSIRWVFLLSLPLLFIIYFNRKS